MFTESAPNSKPAKKISGNVLFIGEFYIARGYTDRSIGGHNTGKMICPKCKEDRVRRAERVSAIDHFVNYFFFKPYSCHACQHRFHALRRDLGGQAIRAELLQRFTGARFRKERKRNKREFFIYVFAALIIGAIIYYLAQQRA